MNTKLAVYETLELLPRGSLTTFQRTETAKRPGKMRRLAAYLLRLFAPAENQPRINIRYSLNGEMLFDAYDPVTQQRLHHSSEDALRAWLEQRYYD
jgi:hypothetical protein